MDQTNFDSEARESLARELRAHMLGLSFEERIMVDNALCQAADEMAGPVEDELVDDYVAERLSEEERLAFERRLMPLPEIRDKLLLSRALHKTSDHRQRTMEPLWEPVRNWLRPIWSPAPAVAMATVVLALSGGSWSVIRMTHLERQLEVASRGTAIATPAVIAHPLSPASGRAAGDTVRVEIVAERRLAELRLDIGIDDFENYRAVLLDSEDGEVASLAGLEAVETDGSVVVVVPLPMQLLKIDDYRVQLSGVASSGAVEALGSYPFRAIAP